MQTSIYRDPFARGNITREQVTGFSVDRTATGDSYGERLYSCAWCGRVRYTRNGHPFAYRYGWSDDQGPQYSGQDARLFCSKDCRDSFNA